MNKRSVERLSQYRIALIRYKGLGFRKIYSNCLADAIGATSVQVRKDFSFFRIKGNKKGGYAVDEILEKLNLILGKDKIQNIVIIGAGRIGDALSRFKGFESEGIRIAACFEIDSAKYRETAKVPILPMDALQTFIKENGTRVGILCVPEYAAQHVAEIMCGAGITGILNFAPIRLTVPATCVVNNVRLAQEIENLIYFTSATNGVCT
jgi:redox-sensing transcriptional repressor